jgi:putative acetyltransferase
MEATPSTIRTTADDPRFTQLVKLLDRDLAIRDGEDADFYAQYNHVDLSFKVVLVIENDIPVSCGAMKPFDENTMEVKRMYTRDAARGKGFAQRILSEIEAWARALNYQRLVLETGIHQPEAIALNKKYGFQIIDNYGQYAAVETSYCFEKSIVR